MSKLLMKKLMAGIVLANFFYSNDIAVAYDLPKVKVEKIETEEDSVTNKKTFDESNLIIDKNYIFIGNYKGLDYYLDFYSIKIKKNKPNKQVWSQFIFPIGPNVKPPNSRSKSQKFYFDGVNAYNSTRKNNLIEDLEDEEDRTFLLNCFEIGYQYAFDSQQK